MKNIVGANLCVRPIIGETIRVCPIIGETLRVCHMTGETIRKNHIMGEHAGSPQHHRRSIRLKGYDYSQAGLYFITICTQHRAYLFGEIRNGEMILNDAGKMVEKWYDELQNKFNDIKCHAMVVMPNHFHCIVENTGSVGVGPIMGENVGDGNMTGETIRENHILGEHVGDDNIMGEHVGSPLRDVVRWFKTMTTNHYIRGVKQNNWTPFDGKLWQRNYYEHIIRNDESYQRISEYIINNPANWNIDKLKQ